MKVFSPYQTEVWLQCPIKRILMTQEHWVTRELTQSDISMTLGLAVGKGLEAHNLGQPDANQAAREAALTFMGERLNGGRTVPDRLQTQWERVPERAEAGVKSYTGADVFPRSWQITAVEQSFGPAGGYARPDLQVNDGRGENVPFDYKVSLSLGTEKDRERNKARRIGRFMYAHQLMHYAWFLKADHFYIGFMVLEPWSFEVLPFEIHPELMLAWEQATKQAWHDMEEEDESTGTHRKRVPLMAAQHSDEFGDCVFQKACLEYHWDPTLMARDYVQVKRWG